MAKVTTRCPGHHRHWFTERGSPSIRLPYCERCGAQNPKWAKQRPAMVDSIGEEEVQRLEREGW